MPADIRRRHGTISQYTPSRGELGPVGACGMGVRRRSFIRHRGGDGGHDHGGVRGGHPGNWNHRERIGASRSAARSGSSGGSGRSSASGRSDNLSRTAHPSGSGRFSGSPLSGNPSRADRPGNLSPTAGLGDSDRATRPGGPDCTTRSGRPAREPGDDHGGSGSSHRDRRFPPADRAGKHRPRNGPGRIARRAPDTAHGQGPRDRC